MSKAESSALAQALGVRLLFTLQADPQVLLNARSKEKPIVAGDGIQSGKQTQTHVLQQWNFEQKLKQVGSYEEHVETSDAR
ncbi:hypothetical protein [Nitrosospira multiformis]|uniref:hypothetical protein n=1 Tax=Nitrosospira multiformis TaxID=1231 RepID=UPI000945D5F9|nr:hypothetical protein [Nitrosospira multiformis]